MERACFLLQVKPELLSEYLAAHDVWPEMLAAMHEAGLRNYSMFFRPDGLLVGYLEGEDIQGSLRRLGETDVNRRWQASMARFFEAGSGDMESGDLQWLERFFYMP
jgi:L-rhamnose mutarotase